MYGDACGGGGEWTDSGMLEGEGKAEEVGAAQRSMETGQGQMGTSPANNASLM